MRGKDKHIIDVIHKIAQREMSAKEGFDVIRHLSDDSAETSGSSGQIVFCRKTWCEAAPQPHAGDEQGALLYIRQHGDAEDESLRLFRASGQSIVEVEHGAAYTEAEGDIYSIDIHDAGHFQRLFEDLEKKGRRVRTVVTFLNSEMLSEFTSDITCSFETIFSLFYNLTRALYRFDSAKEIKILCAYRADGAARHAPLFSALGAFGRSVHLENPKLHYKLVSFFSTLSVEEIADRMLAELVDWAHPVSEVKYESGKRFEGEVAEVDVQDLSVSSALFKQGGVYVVTGGMGGLGLIFAQYLAQKYKARLILGGRRDVDGRIEEQLKKILGLGAQAFYVQCDVTKREDVRRLLDAGRQQFGHIDGILHAAGVLRDALLDRKAQEDIDSVTGPKVQGTVFLDAESLNDKLDAFILFSSLAGITGNVGQADYAFANAFMDSFSEWREERVGEGERFGRTISIAWPLWEAGGMHVDDETRSWMQQVLGLEPLDAHVGLEIFESLSKLEISQIGVLYGDATKLRNALLGGEEQAPRAAAGAEKISGEVSEELYARVRTDVILLVSGILKIRASDIDVEADMSEYGFDSITITAFANKLNAKYNIGLRPSLFFEHPSIGSILTFLTSEYADKLHDYYQLATTARPSEGKTPFEYRGVERRRSERRASRLSRNAPSEGVHEPVAVVGMSGVFPQSADLKEFWRHLRNCDDLITEIPFDRWDWRKYYGDQLKEKNKTSAKWGGFMREVDRFDASFFNISPYEAELMDPQQRIFMEVVWRTIEDAGYRVASLAGSKTGLFVGVSTNDYAELLQRRGISVEAHTSTGLAHSVLANRISYVLDLHGPSEPIDTACSSSLIAIHRAVRSIHDGDCDMAIAGGVSAILTPTAHISFSKAGMLSEDGRCKTFDKKANGYVRGEGAGAVLLKPLSKAIRDGDHIYGVIRGSAENHGGHVSSLTVPNPLAQAELLQDVYTRAGIEPWRIGYIECHGTGTALGDPVEVNGLKRAFSAMYDKYGKSLEGERFCGLGTVKTNIGHLEAAAGIAGFIKVLLSMQHKVLPGVVHFQELNPHIDFEGVPFYIVHKTMEWEPQEDRNGKELPRIAGVSSFGFGGANAHIALEEYVEDDNGQQSVHRSRESSVIVILSAKNKERLDEYAKSLLSWLEDVERGAFPDAFAAVREALIDDLSDAFTSLLGLHKEDVDVDICFAEYGLDEFKFASLAESLNDKYDIDLSVEVFTEVDTLESLAAYLLTHYSQQVVGVIPAEQDMSKKEECWKDNLNLEQIAYTLQVGRDAMNERLALVAQDFDELKVKLAAYLQGHEMVEGVHAENAKIVTDKDAIIGKGEADRNYIRDLLSRGNMNKIAALWANGSEIDWESFYSDRPRRISLPTYPFDKQRYWLPGEAKSADQAVGIAGRLHELIDSNISTLEVQCYRKKLIGNEFFLRDHVVSGMKVLPGVVYLEMARISGEFADNRSKVLCLSEVTWLQPVTVDAEDVELNINLYPADEDVGYEISSCSQDARQNVIHSQGKIRFGKADEQLQAMRVDVDSIRSRCGTVVDRERCYQLFRERGLAYGPSFQTIRELRHSESESFAELEIPTGLEETLNQYFLHPSLTDGLLQSVLGVMGDIGEGIYVPFSVREVEIIRPMEARCYAYVRLHEGGMGEMRRFDLTLVNTSGEMLVRLNDFAVRLYGRQRQSVSALGSEGRKSHVLRLEKKWVSEEGIVPEMSLKGTVLLVTGKEAMYDMLKGLVADDGRLIHARKSAAYRKINETSYELRTEELEDFVGLVKDLDSDNIHPDTIIYTWDADSFTEDAKNVSENLNEGIFSLYSATRALAEAKPQGDIKILSLMMGEGRNPFLKALSGFARSINQENRKFQYKLVYIDTSNSDDELSQILEREVTNWGNDGVEEIQYSGGLRSVQRIIERPESAVTAEPSLFKQGGVYVITGGMGGLGGIFASYLSKTYGAKLVLSGRRQKDERIEDLLHHFADLGGEAIYYSCDVTRRDEVKGLLQAAREQYGRVDGVLHAAGVLKDAILVKKTRENMESVINPKIYGAINLDEASRKDDLDVFIMFSSLAGVMGNVGQSDYAYANQFMDAFSAWRSGLVERGARKGKTLSVDWPLWEQGGMAVDEETLQWMRQTMGMLLLPTENGIQVLESGLQGDQSVVSFVYGDVPKLRSFFGVAEEGDASQKIEAHSTDVSQEAEKELFERLRCDVVKLVSEILKVKEDDVHIDEDMSEYGFDSITVTAFANKINALYDLSLMPAIFFEHFTIASILHHLISQYGETLRSHYALQCGEVGRPVKGENARQVETRTHARFRSVRAVDSSSPSLEQEPIAVVGMSGMFPRSSNLVEFWRSLENSQDLITEIPSDRWDWQEYFGDPMGGVNRTRSKWGGFMKQVDEFDAAFFNISPREAMLMDPQQRLFLQAVWQCIEDAGYSVRSFSGSKTGLFVGVASSDYKEVLHQANVDINAYMPTGLAHSVLANRISYLLDFHGPSEPIDTACSSSLIAIHRAVRSIQDSDCEMAIAGGVNVILTPTLHIAFGQAGMLSPEGRCRTFDQRADGYVRGEGVGAVLLKRLSKAKRDGDHIYGVIRATGENHGGHVNALTVPNPVAQAELLVDVYERAGIEPWRIGYIECHGTGTSLGDPVEVNGLKRAFAELYRRHGKQFQGSAYCGLGTVKTNIGHLEAAAGIAGFIKALLSMKHKRLPGVVHFQTLNPQIEISDTPFYIVENTRPWECAKDESGREYPRVMGISSFGFGGANAHVAVEEWCDQSVCDETQKEQGQNTEMILLSAKNEVRLHDYVQEYIAYLEAAREGGGQTLHDIAYTLQVGRDAFEERLSLVVNSLDELIDLLQRYQRGEQGGDKIHRGKAGALKDKAVLLDEGEDAVSVISKLFHEGRYNRIAALWANGLDVDWVQIYHESAHQARRLSLPVYPFEKRRFWPERKQPTQPQMHKRTQGNEVHPQRTNSTDEESGLAAVIQSLVSIIASRSTVDDHALDGSMRLSDVGVDSVAMLEIAGDVISQFPFMESNGTELLKSFQSMTIEEIARIICDSRHETPSEDRGAAYEIENAFDFNALSLEQKSDKQNILCDSLRLITNDPLKLEGRLVVDEEHPFFFDHPLDHISGMQLVESMIQICSLAYQYAFGRDGEIAYLMNSKVSFRNFCKKDQPSMLLAVAGEGKNDDKALHYYSGEILQNGKTVASGSFGFQSLDADERQKEEHSDTKMLTKAPDMVPCAPDIINKTRPENVIISRVENTEMGVGCWMLPLRKHAFFSDHAYGLLHGAQILEACRQSLRAIEYSMRKKQKRNVAFSHKGKMALLHDMSMSLKRPLRNRDVVFINSMDPVITKVGNNILMKHETVLLVEGEDVGSCKVSAMVLEKEMYNGWRDDGVSATLKMKE